MSGAGGQGGFGGGQGMELKIGQCSEQGRRDNNEDELNTCRCGDATLFIVADGMGGGSGQLASRLAVDAITESISKHWTSGASDALIAGMLRQACKHANHELCARMAQDRALNFGTTVALGLCYGREALSYANLGNTSIHHLSEHSCRRLTIDRLEAARASARAEGNELAWIDPVWPYLGMTQAMDWLELGGCSIACGDRLLFSTDGLINMLDNVDLKARVQQYPDPQRCAEALCQLALERGSRDNVSCIVIEVV
jgi:serine/threonine protein phosphatase PrpC